MKEKQAAGVFLVILLIVIVLGLLLAVAIPHVGQMLKKSKTASLETEFQNIPTAVTGMRCGSGAGIMGTMVPAAGMNEVHTGVFLTIFSSPSSG
jgi:hypothetical protein